MLNDCDAASGGLCQPSYELQESGFAGPAAPIDQSHLLCWNFQAHICE